MQVLDRLRKLFAQDPRWDSTPFKALRASLEEHPTESAETPAKKKPTDAEIKKLLSDSDPERRAEGLAAAGYYQADAFYAAVQETALRGTGIERNAAVYALGFYGHDLPADLLRELMTSDDVDSARTPSSWQRPKCACP